VAEDWYFLDEMWKYVLHGKPRPSQVFVQAGKSEELMEEEEFLDSRSFFISRSSVSSWFPQYPTVLVSLGLRTFLGCGALCYSKDSLEQSRAYPNNNLIFSQTLCPVAKGKSPYSLIMG
jgi:hypothetical protein